MSKNNKDELNRYSVCIVQREGESSVDVTHIQLYGRSEYEAIGYALKKRIISSGKLLSVNAFNCDNPPEIDNSEALLEENREENSK